MDVLLLAMAVPLAFPLVSIVFNPGDQPVLQVLGRATHLALLYLGWAALLLLGFYGPRCKPAQPLLACLSWGRTGRRRRPPGCCGNTSRFACS